MMQQYLESTDIINWHNPSVNQKAAELASTCRSESDIVRACFHFVRDHIKHSWDYQLNPVTLTASEVLSHQTGYCYAKSHLLAALLRANAIPCGLCYQRLTITDVPPFCLHGLNAVYLSGDIKGWYRIDARGNKAGVNAEFCPPKEQLAFPIVTAGECDLPEIWHEPLPTIVDLLRHSTNYQDVADNLPDIELLPVLTGDS